MKKLENLNQIETEFSRANEQRKEKQDLTLNNDA